MTSFQEEYSNENKPKKVCWSDSNGGELCQIKYIHQTPLEQITERKAKNFREVCNLVRYFNLSPELGGSGGSWLDFESKVKKLEEPDWCMIGQLWKNLYGSNYRLEEFSLDSKLDTSESNILNNLSNESNTSNNLSNESINNNSFDNFTNLLELESYLDNMDDVELVAKKLSDIGF